MIQIAILIVSLVDRVPFCLPICALTSETFYFTYVHFVPPRPSTCPSFLTVTPLFGRPDTQRMIYCLLFQQKFADICMYFIDIRLYARGLGYLRDTVVLVGLHGEWLINLCLDRPCLADQINNLRSQAEPRLYPQV